MGGDLTVVMPPDVRAQVLELLRLAVERVASDPQEEQRYLELNFALDRAVERNLRYRDLLELFEDGAISARPEARWAWCLAAGLGANLTGDAPVAIQWLTRAGELLGARSHTAAASFLHAELARAYYHSGDHAVGIETASRALQLARSAGSLLAEAYSRQYLGLISIRLRDYEYARRHLTGARDLFEHMNQRHGRARVFDSLAALDMEQGEYGTAQVLLRESLAVKEELRDLRGQALTCGNLARLHIALGDYPQAMHFLVREQELTSRVGDERNATHVRIQLGRLHIRYGNPAEARNEFLAACEMARQRRDARLEAHACFTLARAEQQLGNTQAGLEAIARARAYFTASDDVLIRNRVLLREAILQGHDLEDPAIQEPLARLREAEAGNELSEALFEVATAFDHQGKIEQLAALYAEALDAAEPVQATQLAVQMRNRAESVEGRAWVSAMLAVKEQKDKLERAYAQLRRAEALRDALTQMIVHDLKNPLTAILPWLQTIQGGTLTPEETSESLQTVIHECDYLLRMIEDLNDVGKMQHEGKLELLREPVDLAALLTDVAYRLQNRARENGMEIHLRALPALPPVNGDLNKLRRLLENLVANGIKYGRPPEESGRPSEVWLAASLEPAPPEGGPQNIRVEVCDFGVGIPAAEAERVFEAYYQAEAGRKRKAGVGLGLAFSRMVVEAHGGTIWTEPNPQGGSIFAFRVPAEG